MSLSKRTLRASGQLRPYRMGNDLNDKNTVTQISSAAMSALTLPTSKFRVKKQTFFIGGAEHEFVMDISVVTT